MIPPRWRTVLDIEDEEYAVFTREFFSTFEFRPHLSLTNDQAVVFTLGGQLRHISMADFAVMTGIYTRAETATPEFTESYRCASVRKSRRGISQRDLKAWWPTIGDEDFESQIPATYLRDPLHRLLQRVIACTVSARYQGREKLTLADLFVLHCILAPVQGNPAIFLLHELHRSRIASGRICQGWVVTRLARHYAIVDEYIPRTIGPVYQPSHITERDMMQMMILEGVIGHTRLVATRAVGTPRPQVGRPPRRPRVSDASSSTQIPVHTPEYQAAWMAWMEQCTRLIMDRLDIPVPRHPSDPPSPPPATPAATAAATPAATPAPTTATPAAATVAATGTSSPAADSADSSDSETETEAEAEADDDDEGIAMDTDTEGSDTF
jgi:hypothetical protein